MDSAAFGYYLGCGFFLAFGFCIGYDWGKKDGRMNGLKEARAERAMEELKKSRREAQERGEWSEN